MIYQLGGKPPFQDSLRVLGESIGTNPFGRLFGICLVVAFTLKAWEIAGILQKCLSPTDGNYAKIRPTANYTEIAGNCTGFTGYCAEIVRNYAGW
jgi:hypothetical protein